MSTDKPLHILRQWIKDGRQIDESQPGFLKVDNVSLDLNLPTEYISKRGKGEPYTLLQVWFLLQNENMKYADFVTASKQQGIQNVLYQDKTYILDWLRGKFAKVDGIIDEEPEPESQSKPPTTQEETAAIPAVQAQETQHEEQPEPEQSQIEVAVEQEVDIIDKGPTVEFDRLRPIDSCILCNKDFSSMIEQTNIFDREDKIKPQQQISNPIFNPRDDSWINQQGAVPEGKFKNYIILVTRSTKSTINNTNIVTFLTKNVWEPPKLNENLTHQRLSHMHSVTMQRYQYDIVADESLMKDDDWNRVVAVFLLGKKWQIKNFKPNDQRQLFEKVLGIYVGFDDAPLPEDIQKWVVKDFRINKTRRTNDAQVVQNIWHEIEEATEALKKRRKEK
ncbi:protein CDC73 [Histomonas meleagridis]|uniref:protein CDC73-like n=1 Tax=Histomonas meleagridis TaxID=135588 RepID=UPI00355AA6CF|nr:protein CDC73 [Histomonas meleagridis]KAH0802925.1 protein CDC73-like [Histomonas meleagridis]